MSRSVARPFTGRHMAAIMIAFFGVVITVNVVMARFASSTFGGVVVDNSYVASQHFNRWLDEASAERQLGWHATITHAADGTVRVALTGVPAGATVTGEAWGGETGLPTRYQDRYSSGSAAARRASSASTLPAPATCCVKGSKR